MNSCTSCGHESASTARFCSVCGLPLISPTAAGAEILTGVDKSRWLTSVDSSDDRVVRAPGVRRGVKNPVALAAAAVVVVIVVWNVFRAPTTGIEGVAGDLDVMATPTSTTVSFGDETAAAADADDTGDTGTAAGEPDQVAVAVADLDPALGGYHLFAQQSGRLLRVDLATGDVETHNVTGRLMGEYARRLYFVDRNGAVNSLPVDDLDAEPLYEEVPVDPDRDLIAAALTAEGIVHLTIGRFSSALPELAMIRVDLATGSTQQVEIEQYGTVGLVEVPTAGLFELADDGFRSLVDGSVRFYGERLIVVEECDAPGSCRRFWLDRQTGQEIERPVPQDSSGWLLGPGGRIAVSLTSRGRVFVDTETGETLSDLIGNDSDRIPMLADDVTSDERFLAAVPSTERGDVRIHDLAGDVAWTLDLPRTFNLSKVLFVPKQVGDP